MGLLNNPYLLGAAFVGVLVYSAFGGTRLRRNGEPLRKPPNTLPLAGNGIVFLQERQKLFAWFSWCERLYGYETLQISVPTLPPGVIISDPQNLEYVFKHEGIFAKGDFVKRRSWDLFGHGIINVDGELWKVQRKAGLSFLNTANLKVLTQSVLPRYVSQSVQLLHENADGKKVLDMQGVFHEITTQLMGNMAYNMEMHADDEFSTAFDYASGKTAERFQNPLWPVTEIFFGSRLRQSIALVKKYGDGIVASALQDRARKTDHEEATETTGRRAKSKMVEGSLIQSFLDNIGDEKMVAEAALNYLSAGRDTTAQALTWTLYLLTKHPEVVDQIRTEVDGVLGNPQEATGSPVPDIMAKIQDIASLPYTHAVFNESLRLFPPIPFEIKQAMQQTTLPDGTFLPQGSVVVWCPWAMNRSYTTWGTDADDFRPERWLVDGRVMNRSAAEFPVFNGGQRTCLGKKMAETMAVQIIAVVLGRFNFQAAEEGERESKSSLTLPMKGGLPCWVTEREAAS